MRYWIGGVVGACCLLLSGATAWGDSCEGLPANSLSRVECERAAKKESEPRPQPNEMINLGASTVAPVMGRNLVTPEEFVGSPMRFAKQKVNIYPVMFRRRIESDEATFVTRQNREILIVGIPADEQFTPGVWYALTIVPLGVETGVNALGGPVPIPVARFVAAPDF